MSLQLCFKIHSHYFTSPPSLTHSLTLSLIHAFTHSLNHSLILSFNQSLNQWVTMRELGNELITQINEGMNQATGENFFVQLNKNYSHFY
jgi:hypothetical protein